MADRTRPYHFTKGPPCLLCGRPNLLPGHTREERETLRNVRLRETIAALFIYDGVVRDLGAPRGLR